MGKKCCASSEAMLAGVSTRLENEQVRELLESGAQLVEVLPADEYREEHLPGALSIPLKQLDAATTAILDKRRAVVVYCWDYI
jgi:rhodanese-related sulfurtransferase